MKVVIDMIRGFCMAMADSVPGVSGGTIAFLMGFYDKFINSLNDLISGKKAEKIGGIIVDNLLNLRFWPIYFGI